MIDYGCTCVEKEDWKGWFDENTLIDSSINCYRWGANYYNDKAGLGWNLDGFVF